MSSKGFIYYAHNNNIINYLKLAIASALTGHYQLNEFIATVVTDTKSVDSLDSKDKKLLAFLFDQVIVDNDFDKKLNFRCINNVFENQGKFPWWNKIRTHAYNDSPYDETILIDVDFIFQDNNLDKIWGSISPILMNKEIIPIINENHATISGLFRTDMVSEFTIPLFWATITYFRKSDFAQEFFNLIELIQDEYEYYCGLYQIQMSMYRNDFSFSIALHIMSGFVSPTKEYEIPVNYICTTEQDQIVRIDKNCTKFIIFTRNPNHPWNLINVKNLSYHCLNKTSLLQNYDDILEVYNVFNRI